MTAPFLAPDPADSAARTRSLVLAGGGMRVAYQAGVLVALERAGLRFHHVDGTSGGTMNLSMLLSGQSSQELCARWRALEPRSFVAPLRWNDYIRSPHWPGMGSGVAVRDSVFPALGIDADRIREARGLVGTYNVANFSTKTAEVVEHRQVDPDLLLACVSLPVLMPAVVRAGSAYTDAVWIRDSNVPEAVRRGSDEVWLVWCIGNTPAYTSGLFRQYVHTIEMAANGSLLADLDRLAGDAEGRTLRLHVIKPSRPLPLDSAYYFGRIDGGELIDLGYQDAMRYLRQPAPLSAPWAGVTAMSEADVGAAARLVLTGPFSWGAGRAGSPPTEEIELRLRVEAGRPESGVRRALTVAGQARLPGTGVALVEQGTAVVAGAVTGLQLDLELSTADGTFRLRARPSGSDLAVSVAGTDGTTKGSGTVRFGSRQVASALASVSALNAASVRSAWRARAGMAHTLWHAARTGARGSCSGARR